MGHMANADIVTGNNASEAVISAIRNQTMYVGGRTNVGVTPYPVRTAGITHFEAGLITDVFPESDGPVLTSPVLDEDTLGDEQTDSLPNKDKYGDSRTVVMEFASEFRDFFAVTGFFVAGEDIVVISRVITAESKPKPGQWFAMSAYHI